MRAPGPGAGGSRGVDRRSRRAIVAASARGPSRPLFRLGRLALAFLFVAFGCLLGAATWSGSGGFPAEVVAYAALLGPALLGGALAAAAEPSLSGALAGWAGVAGWTIRAGPAPLRTVASQVPHAVDPTAAAVWLALVATMGFALVALALPRLPQTRQRLRFSIGILVVGGAIALASLLLQHVACPPGAGLAATCGAQSLLGAGTWTGIAVASIGLTSLVWTVLAAVWGRLWLWTL